LRKKGNIKPVVNYPSKSKTRATNKLRLNSKALFHPSIKKENVIIIDDGTMESKEEEKGQSIVTSSHKLKNVKLDLEDKFNGEIRSGKESGQSDLEDVFKEATRRVKIRGKALSF
jgi:hypothetical protein